MTPETSLKIRRHKYGKRKLATPSGWQSYSQKVKANQTVGSTFGRYNGVLGAIANDVEVKRCITAMNATLASILPFFGIANPDPQIIKLGLPNEMFIPYNVWMGRIKLYGGSLLPADKVTVKNFRTVFADNAGLLRHRVAQILATESVINDLSNDTASPNPGGVGGLPRG